MSDLIGKEIFFQDVVRDAPAPADIGEYVTLYVGDDDEPLMLAGGDIAFCSFSGAALALVPKGRAEDAIASGEKDEDLFENYLEIMNVVTRAVNDMGGPHIRLIPGSGAAALADLPEPTDGRTLVAKIDNYGEGNLSFWKF